jgi:uncharacterized protein YxeA
MKRQYSALTVLILTLGALAMQSCESTDGQNTYYNRGHDGYYHDNRYAEDTAYYHERGYAPDDYQSDGTAIDVHLTPDFRR